MLHPLHTFGQDTEAAAQGEDSPRKNSLWWCFTLSFTGHQWIALAVLLMPPHTDADTYTDRHIYTGIYTDRLLYTQTNTHTDTYTDRERQAVVVCYLFTDWPVVATSN